MARPRKKKVIRILILIILSRTHDDLGNDITDGIWERLSDAMGRVLCRDEEEAGSVYDAAEAIADAVDPEAVAEATVQELEAMAATLETELG